MLATEAEPLYRMRKSHRVVVTGMGAVTPVGLNVSDTVDELMKGTSGIKKISTSDWEGRDDARIDEVDIAGLVMGFDASQYVPKKELKRMHRSAQFSLVACREAMLQAGLLDPSFALKKGEDLKEGENPLINVDPERFGMIIGTGIGGGSVIAGIEDILRGDKANPAFDSFSMLLLLPERVATIPSIWLNAQAEVSDKGAACATGAEALADAFRIISCDGADVVAAGASEAAVHRVALHSFNKIHALNNERNNDPEGASRPFDQAAKGFVMGEGAAVLILESLEHAIGRRANILAEFIGYGNTADAYHDTRPNMFGAIRAMRKALIMAEIDPSEVDYINTHGTSTPTNDVMESNALREVFGSRLGEIPVNSTKSMIGHLLGAAGAVEAAVSIETIRQGKVHPELNFENPIPEAEGLWILLEALSRNIRTVMSNSLGFGGLNAVLIFRRYMQEYQESRKIAA